VVKKCLLFNTLIKPIAYSSIISLMLFSRLFFRKGISVRCDEKSRQTRDSLAMRKESEKFESGNGVLEQWSHGVLSFQL